MTNIKFKEWLKDIAEESEKEGNYLYYNTHIIENPKWVFGDQITLTTGFMTFILYDDIWVFDPEDFEDLKTRLKVLTEVKNTDSDTTRNEDKSKVEAMIIETLQPYREELTRKQIQIIADSIVRKIYERA